ncbi:YkgJ family cysteine cluster protein [Candidatus Zixiibacteriota bacterium]
MKEEMDNLKQSILDNYPRLAKTDKFLFACHQDVPCFNDCCGDVNIFLTPYDIIRLKNHLGITSGEFLQKYTVSPFDKKQKYPVVILKMQDNEKKNCFFVTAKGCSVYPDRPWSCRMYPLGLASPKEGSTREDEFYFLMKEDVCRGFQEKKEQTITEWLDDQGINLYDEMGRLYKELTLHDFFERGGELSPEKMEMFHVVCYNIDKFREFLLQSTFLQKFNIAEDVIEKIKTDDVELFKFGCNWLKFSLYGEKTMTVKEAVLAEKKTEMNNRSTPRG